MSDGIDGATGATPAAVTHADIEAHLAASRRRRRTALVVGGGVAAVLVAGVVAVVVRPSEEAVAGAAAEEDGLVRLTIGDTAQSDFQDAVVEVGREKGLDLDFVNFDDPYLPNTALLEGEVDANSFQHVAWLSQFNVAQDADITPLFSTVVSTWGLFSRDHADAADLPRGARVAVPDDPANFSRALFILETAGVLEVADDAGVFPTEEDVTADPKEVELVRIAHESVQTAYEDPAVDAVVIATDDFDPALGITSDDALALEDASATSSSPYVIVVATTADRADDPEWALLEETYRDERVVRALEEEKRGEATVVELPVEDLRSALAELSG